MTTRVLWINGAFGVGKTTTAAYLLEQLREWRYFDPETVGFLLRNTLSGIDVDDFQDLSSWRRLVPEVVSEIARESGQNVVAVQSVLNEAYWSEILQGLHDRHCDVVHVVLDCEPTKLSQRIVNDAHDVNARQWRLDHIEVYETARPWLRERADFFVDTTDLAPDVIATQLAPMI